MRRLTRSLVGATALSAAFAGGVVVAGGLPSSPAPREPVETPAVRPVSVTGPDALQRFEDCDELLDWYVQRNLERVGPHGWQDEFQGYAMFDGRGGMVPLSGVMRLQSRDTAAKTASETGTNTQENDVDEPDSAKTDGRLVVHLDEGGNLVVTDVSGPKPVRLSSMRVAGYGSELLLVGDRVYVIGREAWNSWGRDMIGPYAGSSRITEIDITDPAQPKLLRTREYDGRVESVRQYGDVVRVVTAKPRPDFAWTVPGGGISKAEATKRNRALVQQSRIEEWLPSVADPQGDDRHRVGCDEVHRPPADSGGATTAIFTWTGDEVSTLGLTADPGVVYSSPDRLYVATAQASGPRGTWTRRPAQPITVKTHLHSFALDGAETSYVASGHVDGTVRDRWSLDEQDGRLRVAFARAGKRGNTRDNVVHVLTEQDGQLTATGGVAGLGIREEIQSVRWFDDFAVVVTFRQTDPLYTISFRDPARPKLLGALKIPGFSAYLHPLGDGRLLGLGQDATSSGRSLGAQAALFDVTALTDPRQVAKQRFPRGSELMAGWDPHAFTWLPGTAGNGTAYTLIQAGWSGPAPLGDDVVPMPRGYGARVAVLTVKGDRLDARVLKPRADERSRVLAVDGGRLVLVGNGVRLLPLV